MHKYIFTLVFGLLILLNNPIIVKAHEVSEKPWLFINNENLSSDNDSPNTSKLEWSEHVLTKNFDKDQKINFKTDLESLGFEQNVEVIWQIYGKDFSGTEVNYTFEKTGNYFIKIEVLEDGKSEFDETFMMIIGDGIMPASFSIEGEEVLSENPTKDISRSKKLEFKVINPDTQKYDYIWDLNDGQTLEATSATKSFESTKLPGYVILRTIDKKSNVFADSYVKLRSEDPQSFEVNMPSSITTSDEAEDGSNLLITSVIVLSGLITLLVLAFGLYWGKKRLNH